MKRRRDREEAEEEREKAQWEEKHREIDEWRAKRIATNIAKARVENYVCDENVFELGGF